MKKILNLLNKNRKSLAASLPLILLSSYAISQAANRMSVQCKAVEGSERTSFACELLQGGGANDAFKKDRYGAVMSINSSTSNSEITVTNQSVGVSNHGGARIVNGSVEVLDSAGRITHKDFSPLVLKPFNPTASSVAILGDSGSSPVKIDLKSPVDGVNSGKALFLGNAKSIDIDISGRDGLDGRSAGVAAALQILKGELGTSDDLKNLSKSMGLSQNLSDPSITIKDLAGSAGTCEAIEGGHFKTPEILFDQLRVKASVDMAKELLVERAICERQVAEEYSIQTICARPPELSTVLRCDYPALVRNSEMWKRPVENKKIAISCSNSVPAGHWDTECAKEEFGVVGSALKAEFITLKPSTSIEMGMGKTLFHHFREDRPKCRSDLPISMSYDAYLSNVEFTLNKFDALVSPSCDSDIDTSLRMNKMDRLRLTGALVYKYNRVAFPGTEAERNWGTVAGNPGYNASLIKSWNPTEDITKLSYWAEKGSQRDLLNNPGASLTRTVFDNLNTLADKPAKFHLLDPFAASASSSADSERQKYFDGLHFLGYEIPTIQNALISYSSITVTKNYTTKNLSKLSDILCSLAVLNGACDSVLAQFDGNSEVNQISKDLRFSEVITYQFNDLKSGLALRRIGSATGDTESYLRALTTTNVVFEPRVFYIPGDLEVKPITKVNYCKTIEIDNDPVLLQNNNDYSFIGPEIYSGATFNTYGAYPGSPYDRNSSPPSDQNQAPTRTIGNWGSSFMRVKEVDVATNNAGCEQVSIEHSYSDSERILFEKFKNQNGVLIKAEANTISVYSSPVKIPKADVPKTGAIYVNESISPGLYMPLINVSPMWLDAPGAYGSEKWSGYGKGKREQLGSAYGSLYRNQLPRNQAFSMSARFDQGISYYAIPPDSTGNGAVNTFDARFTRTLDGANPGSDQNLVLKANGTGASDIPRYIKSFRSLHLGVNDANPQASTNTVNMKNMRIVGNAILTEKIGGLTSGVYPEKSCLSNSFTKKIKYPTKLISRRVENAKRYGSELNNLGFGLDNDPNVVVDSEVSGTLNSIIKYPDDINASKRLYFTRPYLPTTMRRSSLTEPDKTLEEPINLAQDYNSYLSQLQTFSDLKRENNGALTLYDTHPKSENLTSTNPYDRDVLTTDTYGYTRNWRRSEVAKKLLEEIARRPTAMPNPARPEVYGQSPIDTTESACFNDLASNDYCFFYYAGTYRANRMPFMMHSAGAVILGVDGYRISRSRVPLFNGARPWKLYPKGTYGILRHNHGFGTPDTRTANWLSFSSDPEKTSKNQWLSSQNTLMNYDFYAGHFFPFWRTKHWIFYGERAYGQLNGTVPKDGYFDGGFEKWQLTKTGKDFTDRILVQKPSDLSQVGVDINDPSSGVLPRLPYLNDKYQSAPYELVIGGPATYSEGGSETSDGGAYFNPGGFFLPPFGVKGRLSLGRFSTAYNDNVELIDDQFDSNTSWQLSRPDTHEYEASTHMLYNSGVQDLADVYATRSDKTTDAGGDYQEDKLSWVGTSGYLFDKCQDNLSEEKTISYGLSHEFMLETGSTFSKGYFPIGLTISENGGLYYGPLAGKNTVPLVKLVNSGLSDKDFNFLKLHNTVGVNPAYMNHERFANGISVYDSKGLAGQIAQIAMGDVPQNIKRDNSEARTVTVGRILIDAKNDFENPSSSGNFDYENDITLAPEVLAAFFLHADLADEDSTTKGATVNPYDASSKKPSYFSEFFENFLRKGQIASILANGFKKNGFSSKKENPPPSQVYNAYVNPMIFTVNGLCENNSLCNKELRAKNYTQRFAWEFTESSLHMSVRSLNVSNSPNGSVQGINTGVAVSYSQTGNGIFGELTDSFDYRLNGVQRTAQRSEGLSQSNILTNPLVMHSVGGAAADGVNVSFYVTPGETEATNTPWYFSENACGFNKRKTFVPGAYQFATRAAFGIIPGTPVINPFDKFCIASALRAAPTASGNLEKVDIDTVDMEKNIYWDFLRRDKSVQLTGFYEDPEHAPSCPFPSKMKSQTFQVDGISEKTTYSASTGWSGTINSNSDSPGCPCAPSVTGTCTEANNMLEVARVYASLYSEQNLCYDEATGSSTPDLRTNKTLLSCTSTAAFCSVPGFYSSVSCSNAGGSWAVSNSASFKPTYIETAPGPYHEQGTIVSSALIAPSGASSAYNIYLGKIESPLRTIDEIAPSARVKKTDSGTYDPSTDTWWKPAAETFEHPLCDAIPYDEEGVWAKNDPEGRPLLRAKWNFLEEKRRFGNLDSYFVKTSSKQTKIPGVTADGLTSSIAGAGDLCDWGSISPQSVIPTLKNGVTAFEGEEVPLFNDFTYAIGYDFISGASSALTTRQFTPWSTERTDGQTLSASSCQIFNDENTLAREKTFNIPESSLGEDRIFKIGEGATATTYKANLYGSRDSSVIDSGALFVTGGTWVRTGVEQKNLTKSDIQTVNCEFFINSADGQDKCSASIPMTYETVEGFQITTRAEAGEHGGNAGTAVVLTTDRPDYILLKANAGKAGLAGNQTLSGSNSDKNLVCYEKSENILSPWIKFYRFNKSVVNVAPASNGNPGRAAYDRSYFGWGVPQEALDWIKKSVLENVDKDNAAQESVIP